MTDDDIVWDAPQQDVSGNDIVWDAPQQNPAAKSQFASFTLPNSKSKVTLDPDIGERLWRANANMVATTGMPIIVDSSHRTREQQKDIYRRFQEGKVALAAKHGNSRHEKGLAIDVRNWKEAAPFLAKQGLVNPFINKKDPGHFQLSEPTRLERLSSALGNASKMTSILQGTEPYPEESYSRPSTPTIPVDNAAPSGWDNGSRTVPVSPEDSEDVPELTPSQVESMRNPARVAGGILGGIVSVPSTAVLGPFGTVLGAGGGSAIADQLMNYIKQRITGQKDPTLEQAIIGPTPLMDEDNYGAAGAFGFGAGQEMGGQVFGKVASTSKSGIDVINAPNYITGQNELISKAFRPGFTKGSRSAPQQEKYMGNTLGGIHDIVENKSVLNLTDDFGNKVELPQTLGQAQQAREQLFWKQLERTQEMAKSANNKLVLGDLKPVISDLKKTISDESFRLHNKGAVQRAEELIAFYEKKQFMTPLDMEKEITNLNNLTREYSKSAVKDKFGENAINLDAADAFRNLQYSTIERAEGPGYAELRRSMRDLKTFEDDLNRRAWVDARKAVKGVFDLGDIFSVGKVFRSLSTGNVTPAIEAAGQKAVQEYYKRLNSPDKQVQKLFQNADNAVKESQFYRSNQPPTGPFVPEETPFSSERLLPPRSEDMPGYPGGTYGPTPPYSQYPPPFGVSSARLLPAPEKVGGGTYIAGTAPPGYATGGPPARPARVTPLDIKPVEHVPTGGRSELMDFLLSRIRPRTPQDIIADNLRINQERGVAENILTGRETGLARAKTVEDLIREARRRTISEASRRAGPPPEGQGIEEALERLDRIRRSIKR